MKSFDDLLSAAKVSDIMHKEDKDDNKIVWAYWAIIRSIGSKWQGLRMQSTSI